MTPSSRMLGCPWVSRVSLLQSSCSWAVSTADVPAPGPSLLQMLLLLGRLYCRCSCSWAVSASELLSRCHGNLLAFHMSGSARDQAAYAFTSFAPSAFWIGSGDSDVSSTAWLHPDFVGRSLNFTTARSSGRQTLITFYKSSSFKSTSTLLSFLIKLAHLSPSPPLLSITPVPPPHPKSFPFGRISITLTSRSRQHQPWLD